MSETAEAATLSISAKAARRLVEVLGADPQAALRISVKGGGCSGFQYGFSFDENGADDDLSVVKEGATLVVDPLSLQYLMGAEIDYTENLQGARFVIRNPNAKTTCGCGSSFTV